MKTQVGSQSYLCNGKTGEILVPRLEVAQAIWQRAVGLIGRASLAGDEALWLHPCNSIHTFGVRFPIDVLFLDAEGRVLHIRHGLQPCRVCWPIWKAKTVVELPAGTLARLAIALGALLAIGEART